MSVIAKQSALNSLVRYAGVALGTVNVLFIYTLCFSEEQIGQLRYIQETAILLTTFFSLGVGNLTVRYFPSFRNDENKHNGFFGLLTTINIAGLLLFLVAMIFSESLGSSAFSENKVAVTVVLGSLMFMNLFTAYASNFQKIVVPEFFNNIFIKIGMPVLALLLFYHYLTFNGVIVGLQWVYIIAFSGLFIYLIRLQLAHFDFSQVKKPKVSWRTMSSYMFFGLLGGVGSVFASRIDIIMITEFFSYKETGIYTIALFIASVVGIPMSSLKAITGPIIAQKIKDNKLDDVGSIYKKSSVNLFILGSLFFMLIFVNLTDVFRLMPNGEKYASGALVVMVIGVGKLFDLITSVNGEIILYSKYYKYTTYFILIMSAINVIANFILIPTYNILGAAIASLISIFIYNIIKLWFIYKKMGIHPFAKESVHLLLIGLGLYVIIMILPFPENPLISVAIKSSIICLGYGLSIYYFKLSAEGVELIKKIIRKIK